MGKSAPSAPDPYAVSSAQTNSNLATAQNNLKLNAPLGNTSNLYGSNTVQTGADGLPTGQTQTMAPWLQQLATGQGNLGSTYQGLSANMLSKLPTGIPIAPTSADASGIAKSTFGAGVTDPNNMPEYWKQQAPEFQKTSFDPSASTGGEATNMAWKGALAQLQPQFDAQQKQFDTTMANRGLPVGSEAYNDANKARIQAQDNALTSAASNAQQVGYGQDLNTANFNAGQNQNSFANALSGISTNNATANQLYNQNLGAQNYGQNAATQGFNSAVTANQLPYSQLSTISSLDPTNNMLSRAPTAANMQGTNVANTDVSGNVWNAYNAQNNQYNNQMAGNASLLKGIGSVALAPVTGGGSLLGNFLG